MNIEAATTTLGLAAAAAGEARPLQAGYNLSLTDLGGFDRALAGAAQRIESRIEAFRAASAGEAVRAVFRPLEHINTEAASLGERAKAALDKGAALTPGEMIDLTVRCQEFMFHCQLASNVANRTSDGLQQLFRQQA